MRYILVTGGAGFIGSYLAERLIMDKENYVVIADNLSTGNPRNLPHTDTDNWTFIKINVNNYKDIAEVMHSFRFDYVFHYAALVGVKRTQDNPVRVLDDIHGIEHILNLAKNSKVRRVFFSSSSEVYGEPVELPQNEETTPLNSRIPYAVVKNVGESFLKSFYKEYGLEYTIFRFFNTYGPRQSKDFVMSKFIASALKNKDIGIYGDGSQKRTFCFVEDNVEACLAAAYSDLFVNDVVNIGTDYEISILDLAKLIINLTKSESKIVFLPPLKEGDMTRRYPDVSKMRFLLQRDLVPIEVGVKKVLNDIHFITNIL
ncbi:MAG: NAD-dependent epimerase/dehydratase family protein [Bacteroidales bacterium]|nr:NAD-dependent epimerase/dehydratase family protein [Bacteroidales bacterium]